MDKHVILSDQLLNLLYVVLSQYGLVICLLNLGHNFKMWLGEPVLLSSLQEIFERSVKYQSLIITADPSHILHK